MSLCGGSSTSSIVSLWKLHFAGRLRVATKTATSQFRSLRSADANSVAHCLTTRQTSPKFATRFANLKRFSLHRRLRKASASTFCSKMKGSKTTRGRETEMTIISRMDMATDREVMTVQAPRRRKSPAHSTRRARTWSQQGVKQMLVTATTNRFKTTRGKFAA